MFLISYGAKTYFHMRAYAGVFFFRTLRRSKDVIFNFMRKIFTKFCLTCIENNLFNFLMISYNISSLIY